MNRLAGLEGLHFAGGTAVTRRDLAEATCRVFGLDAGLVSYGPPPDSARIPAPVPYDTSMSGEVTAALLGTRTWAIEDQLGSLEQELSSGRPVPLS